MSRVLIMAFAIKSYVVFLAVSVWLAAFLLNIGSIRSSGSGTPWPQAAGIDILLISVFGLVHSVMARPAFKRRWTRIIPEAAERAIYVMQSSVLLAAIMLFWQPIPVAIWSAQGLLAAAMLAVFLGGWVLIVIAIFALDHFEFTGLRQAWSKATSGPAPEPVFRTPLPYRVVRHPLQLGILLVMFSVPQMTADGLLFAVVMLAYMLIGLRFEERALLREFGEDYAAYRTQVPMLLPRLPLISKLNFKQRRV